MDIYGRILRYTTITKPGTVSLYAGPSTQLVLNIVSKLVCKTRRRTTKAALVLFLDHLLQRPMDERDLIGDTKGIASMFQEHGYLKDDILLPKYKKRFGQKNRSYISAHCDNDGQNISLFCDSADVQRGSAPIRILLEIWAEKYGFCYCDDLQLGSPSICYDIFKISLTLN